MPVFNITNARENLRNLQNELEQARTRGRELANDTNATTEDMEAQAATIRQLTARLALMQQEISGEEGERSGNLSAQRPVRPAADAMPRNEKLAQILASREYARAFALAIQTGATVNSGRYDERLGVLYDALTEVGGSPEGSNGGFLVPEDIDHTIREYRRQIITLSSLFDVQTVSTPTGKRTKDTAPTKGFTKLDGEMSNVPEDDQPSFTQVPYTLDTYGLNIPVSNELAADEVAGLFNYIARFFARKHVLTENKLLLELLDKTSPTNFTPSEKMSAIGMIKRVLNKMLDPAISMNAAILTNQSGYDYLDQLVDANGRPILQPDPTSGTPMLLKTRRIVMASDKELPNVGSDGLPFYIGDFEQYGTLFMRQNLEMASTNVGGNAWRTNSTEVRGITRLGTGVFDDEAVVRLTVKAGEE